MKKRRYISSDFKRFRIKKNEKEWTTISLETDLIDLIKLVFQLSTDNEVKDFINRITNECDFNVSSYSQEVKRKIFKKIKERYEALYCLIQPKLI